MSVSDDELVDRMAKKHAVSSAAVHVVLAALRSGGGRMAQFSHADFGGMSQWATCSTRNPRPSDPVLVAAGPAAGNRAAIRRNSRCRKGEM
jgi:hypothetical protein